MIFVLSLSPRNTFYPHTSLLVLPHPQSLFCKFLWKTWGSWQQHLSVLILSDVLWEMYFYMAETDCPLRPLWWLDHNKNDRRDTRDRNIYFHWVLEKMFIIQKHAFFIWLWDRDQTLYHRIYWLKDLKTVKWLLIYLPKFLWSISFFFKNLLHFSSFNNTDCSSIYEHNNSPGECFTVRWKQIRGIQEGYSFQIKVLFLNVTALVVQKCWKFTGRWDSYQNKEATWIRLE